MDPHKLLVQVSKGSVKNIAFDDLQRLVEAMGFELKRISGSHHIFSRADVPELVNLQEVDGQAKPYQIRQFVKLVARYSLGLEERP